MSIPKVFISYSHDSIQHKSFVLSLATRLRQNGIDAIIDQWELKSGDDLPNFMEQNLSNSDFILMICTERYTEKANLGQGGVGYEKMIITSNLLSRIDENKVIPIIRQSGSYNLPTFLKTKLYIDLSKNDDFEIKFDELLRRLHDSPLYVKPEIGVNPFLNNDIKKAENTNIQSQNSTLIELTKVMVRLYESNPSEILFSYTEIFQHFNISRVYFDLMLAEAEKNEIIVKTSSGYYIFTDKGKFFAVENKLIM